MATLAVSQKMVPFPPLLPGHVFGPAAHPHARVPEGAGPMPWQALLACFPDDLPHATEFPCRART